MKSTNMQDKNFCSEIQPKTTLAIEGKSEEPRRTRPTKITSADRWWLVRKFQQIEFYFFVYILFLRRHVHFFYWSNYTVCSALRTWRMSFLPKSTPFFVNCAMTSCQLEKMEAGLGSCLRETSLYIAAEKCIEGSGIVSCGWIISDLRMFGWLLHLIFDTGPLVRKDAVFNTPPPFAYIQAV